MASTLAAILKLEVPIIVRMGERCMSVAEVMALLPGSIIELRKSSDSELDLMVNNKVIGCGGAMKVGENFGIRISYIGNITDRILAMGTPAAEEPVDASVEDLAAAMLAGQV